MKKRRNDEIRVKFYGNSALDVTGSAILISYKNHDYMLDFGMLQGCGGTLEQEYAMNLQYANNLKIDNLKCILVSHQNVDHIGLIPALVKRGFKGDIIGSYKSLEFSKKLLEDCAFINERNVETFAKKGRKMEHLYKIEDVTQTTYQMRAYDIGEIHQFDEYMSYQFVPTSHLTGSCQIIVYIKKDNGTVKKIWYSGDLGSELGTDFGYFLDNTEIVRSSNLAICECTYFGDMKEYSKQDAIAEREDMKKEILQTLHNHGKVVIPAFAMQRSQHIGLTIWEMFKDDKDFKYKVVFDSRLINRINKVYSKILTDEEKTLWEEFLTWNNLKTIDTYKETLAVMATREPMIVISSSGMAQNGHVVEWLKSAINCSRDMVMVVGYSPKDDILDKLVRGDETVKWNGATYKVRCRVKKYNTFSSHLSAKGIIRYLKQHNTNQLVFHHGEKSAKANAVNITKEELTKIGKTTKVMASYKNLEIIL